ncbi:ComEA family DNA-binding protein [Microbacterium sp. cx-55]|nr:ComEA family DNA-binding protein [Microbacterium sp. cx-55]
MLRPAGGPEVVPPAVASSAPGDASVASGHIFVHVSGAVTEPGLYQLVAGARAFDAVAAAGGFAEGADRAAVNLARTVDDGEQLHVPLVGEAPDPASPGAAGPLAGGKIDLNTADLAGLDTLPRVGPAIAQRIIDWRTANGRFTSVDDLLGIPGIGDKMLAGIRDLVTV